MALIGDANVQSNDLIVGELIQRQLIAASKIAGTIMDVSQFAVKGAKSIEFPKAGGFTVVKKTSGTAITEQALTYTTDALDLNQQAVVQWLLEDKAGMQSAVDIELDAVQRAAKAHAKQIDVDIYTEIAATATTVNGDSGNAFRREDIVAGIQELDSNDVPDENRFLAINPAEKADMFNITDFIDASKFGANRIIQNGVIGEVYGIPVLVTTSVDAGAPVMYHMESCAIGFQMAPRFQSDLDLANLATRYSLDQLYGVKGLLGTSASVVYANL